VKSSKNLAKLRFFIFSFLSVLALKQMASFLGLPIFSRKYLNKLSVMPPRTSFWFPGAHHVGVAIVAR